MATSIVTCPHCGHTQPGAARPRRKPRCGNCHQPLPWIADADDGDFAEIAEQAAGSVLVDLWATWCGPCRMVSPALEQLATERAGKLKLVKVDVDKAPRCRSASRSRPCRPCWSSTTGRSRAAGRAPLPCCAAQLAGPGAVGRSGKDARS